MARSLVAHRSRDVEEREIVDWYVDLLEHTAPPADLEWEPVKVGPTWQWDNGWLLPRHTLGWGVLAWCGMWLWDAKAKAPWQFTAEQARFLLWFYAVDEDGEFRHHSAVLQRLKGWGKDPVAACVSSASMVGPVGFSHWEGDRPVGTDEQDAWIQVVAVSQDQTKNTMKLFPGLVPPSTRSHYGIQIGKLAVWALGDTRQIEAVTSSPMAIEGGRPTLIIRGETQNWNESNDGHTMAGAIDGNAAKSENGAARMLDVCNAYRPGEDSVGQRAREGWEATQGEDATQMDYGLLYDSLEAPPEAPLEAEAAPGVVEAIRGDSVWLNIKRIVNSIKNPANPASESRRKWFNQITAAEDAWADPNEWDACGHQDELGKPPAGDEIVMFFDGGKSDDATGLVGCRVSDGHLFVIGVWERPKGDRGNGWVVPRAEVDLRAREAWETWRVVAWWADPSHAEDDDGDRFWDGIIDGWHRDFSQKIHKDYWSVKTGERTHSIMWDMTSPARHEVFVDAAVTFITEMKDRLFTHDRHARLRAHVRNAKRKPTRWGVSLQKEHRESKRKIDLAVCAVGARMLRRVVLNKPRKQRSGKVW